jgi:hypothetical protein
MSKLPWKTGSGRNLEPLGNIWAEATPPVKTQKASQLLALFVGFGGLLALDAFVLWQFAGQPETWGILIPAALATWGFAQTAAALR